MQEPASCGPTVVVIPRPELTPPVPHACPRARAHTEGRARKAQEEKRATDHTRAPLRHWTARPGCVWSLGRDHKRVRHGRRQGSAGLAQCAARPADNSRRDPILSRWRQALAGANRSGGGRAQQLPREPPRQADGGGQPHERRRALAHECRRPKRQRQIAARGRHPQAGTPRDARQQHTWHHCL